MTDDIKMKGVRGITEGFELVVGPPGGIIENADIPIRWCITSEAVKALEDAKIVNPHIVIVTSSGAGWNEWRTVVPLGDMVAYARFYEAGEQNIYAVIIEGGKTPEETKRIIRSWTAKDYGEFEIRVQYGGDMYRNVTESEVFGATTAHVIIPEGVFGKEPSPWVKWYVNLWHGKDKVDDQCEFRRRAMIAFGVKWIPAGLWAITYTVLSAIVLFLVWGGGFSSWITNWKVMFHPFTTNWQMMLDYDEGEYGDLRDSRYIAWIPWGDDGKQPVWFLTALSPLMVTLYAAITFIATSDNGDFWWYDWHVATAWIAMIATILVGAIDFGTTVVYWVKKRANELDNKHGPNTGTGAMVALICFGVFVFLTNAPVWAISIVGIGVASLIVGVAVSVKYTWKDIFFRTWDTIDRFYIMIEDMLFGKSNNDYTEIRELLCPKDHENLTTDIKTIPRERRTWRLRFHAFKNKVCKPMQRI